MCPDATVYQQMAVQANQLAAYCTKEICRFSIPIASMTASGGGGINNRWRHYWHSGPFAEFVYIRALLAPGNGDPGDAVATWEVTDEDAPGALGTATIHFGSAKSGGVTDTPAHFAIANATLESSGTIIPITADTNFSGLFREPTSGVPARYVGVVAYEVSTLPNTTSFYVPQGFTAGYPVLDSTSERLTTLLRDMWKQGAAHLFNWSVPDQGTPRTRTSASAINAVDNSSTSVSVNSPGWTIDLRKRNRLNATTVPCKFAVYASQSAGTGIVRLKDSGGSTVVSINVTGAASWLTASVNLPNTRAKYDLTYEGGGGANQISLHAASLFQYE